MRLDLRRFIFIYFLAHLSQRLKVSYCDRSSSVVRPSFRRPSTFCFKQHLLLNCLANFDKTLQGCSLGGPLSNLFKELNSMWNSGCHGNGDENFKNLFSKTTAQISKWFGKDVPWLSVYQDCSNYLDPWKNLAARGRASFPYVSIVKT